MSGRAAQDLVRDRVHQVGLAEAHAAVEEERVVGAGGGLGDRARGGVGELVGGADDEGVEGEARIQDETRATRPSGPPPAARARAPGAETGSKRIVEPGKARRAGDLAERSAPCRDVIQSAKTRARDRDRQARGSPGPSTKETWRSARTRSSAPWGRASPAAARRSRSRSPSFASLAFPQVFHSCGNALWPGPGSICGWHGRLPERRR